MANLVLGRLSNAGPFLRTLRARMTLQFYSLPTGCEGNSRTRPPVFCSSLVATRRANRPEVCVRRQLNFDGICGTFSWFASWPCPSFSLFKALRADTSLVARTQLGCAPQLWAGPSAPEDRERLPSGSVALSSLGRNSRTGLLDFLLVRLPLDTSSLRKSFPSVGKVWVFPEVVSLPPGYLMQTVATQIATEQHFFSGYFRMTILSMHCPVFHFSWRRGNPGPCAPARSLQRAAANTGKGHFDNREEVLIRQGFRSISTEQRIRFLRLGLWRTARWCWRWDLGSAAAERRVRDRHFFAGKDQ